MGKFCTNCGNALEDNYNVCPNCGTKVNGNKQNVSSSVIVAERNIIVAILLTLITCGIYGIYWFITLTDESNKLSGNTAPSGGMTFLFSLLTCGIYTYFWNYKMGQKISQVNSVLQVPDNA